MSTFHYMHVLIAAKGSHCTCWQQIHARELPFILRMPLLFKSSYWQQDVGDILMNYVLLCLGCMPRPSSLDTSEAWGTSMKTQPSSPLRDAKPSKMRGSTLENGVLSSTRWVSLYKVSCLLVSWLELFVYRANGSKLPWATKTRRARSAPFGAKSPDLTEGLAPFEQNSSRTFPPSLWDTVSAS